VEDPYQASWVDDVIAHVARRDAAPTVEDRYADDGDGLRLFLPPFFDREIVAFPVPPSYPAPFLAMEPTPLDFCVFVFLRETCDLSRRPWVYHDDVNLHLCGQEGDTRCRLTGYRGPLVHHTDVARSLARLREAGLVRTDKVKNRPGKHRTIHHCTWLQWAEEGDES
jgi:hypothetical protein